MRSTLIQNGFVITMDPRIGDIKGGDVLIADGRVVEVGRAIKAADAEIIDATGMIVIPGMVDTHRHTWQTQLRGICADMSLVQYMRCIRCSISPVYTAEDVYVGNYVGALEALNAGVTSLYDFSHTSHSPEHADEAIRGLRDTGIRGIYAYGFYPAPIDEPYFHSVDERIKDAERVKLQHFSSDDDLLTMGVAITEIGMYPFSATRKEIEAARRLGAPQTIHTHCFWGSPLATGLDILDKHGLLGPDQMHIHCNSTTDQEMRYLADNGCHISMTPESELSMGMGHPEINRAMSMGSNRTIGADIISLQSGELVPQARLALQDARCMINDEYNRRGEAPENLAHSVRDALSWITVNGAEAMFPNKPLGTLAPGKIADVVLIAPNDFNLAPLNDMLGAVILQANVSNIDTVIIGGEIKKRHGKLVGHEFKEVLRMAEKSRDRIMEAAAARGPLVPPPDASMWAEWERIASENLLAVG